MVGERDNWNEQRQKVLKRVEEMSDYFGLEVLVKALSKSDPVGEQSHK